MQRHEENCFVKNQKLKISCQTSFKVPKHENFSLAFFALCEPIWVGDLRTDNKFFFYHLTPDFDGFWFFAAY
jgi:hypothetical protein